MYSIKRICFVLIALTLVSLTTDEIFATQTGKLESSDLIITFQTETVREGKTARLTSLIDKQTKREILSPLSVLFRINVLNATTRKETTISSDQPWHTVQLEEKEITKSSRELVLTFKDPLVADKPQVTITVTVRANANEPGIHFSWSGQSRQAPSILRRGEFPLIEIKKWGTDIKTLLPSGPGLIGTDPFIDSWKFGGTGPNGWSMTMGLYAMWDAKTNYGLYFGLHDPDANMRSVSWTGNSKKSVTRIQVKTPFAKMTTECNAFQLGDYVLQTFKGDWYDAAIIYRDWVRDQAKWYPKMGAQGRPDIPLWMKENCVFLMMSTDPRWLTPNRRVATPLNRMSEKTAEFRDATGVPGLVHWYLWHQNSYDNDYPHFFPAKEGFAEEVLKLQKRGDFRAMPYTNGQLWDTRDRGMEDWKFTREGRAGAVKREDGSLILQTFVLPTSGKEEDGSSCVHVSMCPASQVWQDKVRENVLTAMNQYNTQGVYIDMVGSVAPRVCFDASHNHDAGGGHWWMTEGYWKMFQRIREDMRKEVSDFPLSPEQKEILKRDPDHLKNRIITTECNSEIYASVIDGMLVWHWQGPNQIPAFCVVYGGVVPLCGRCSTGDALSVKMRVCEALTFGEQIGWFDANVMDDPEKFPFIRNAIRLRYQIREYFYRGEMARPPKWLDPMPTTSADWLWGGRPNRNTKNSVQTSLWRILNFEQKQKGVEEVERAVLIFSNVSQKEITSRISINLEELGLANRSFTVRKITSEGVETANLPASVLTEPIHFPPETSWSFELIPD